jgi:hypothetical protein
MAWWWNTGCMVIYNQTDGEYTIVYQANPGYRLVVAAQDHQTWNGLIFPWCYEAFDIRMKAFCFYRGSELVTNGAFYMYQPTSFESSVYWTEFVIDRGFPSPSYENGRSAGAPSSSLVDVIIHSDGRPETIQVRP